MIQVTKDSFFSTIGQLNVHPRLGSHPKYDQITGYVSSWEMPYRQVVGKSDGGTVFMPSRFFVTEAFFNSNKSKLVKS